MIGAFVSGILIGAIVGWAVAEWRRHARADASPVERQIHWTAVGGQNTNESVDAQ